MTGRSHVRQHTSLSQCHFVAGSGEKNIGNISRMVGIDYYIESNHNSCTRTVLKSSCAGAHVAIIAQGHGRFFFYFYR